MLFYSELTKEHYKTADECENAEIKFQKEKELERKAKEEKVAIRKAQAGAIEDARKEMVAAQNKYKELVEEFVKNYGSYHYSTKSIKDVPTLFDIFNPFLF